MPNLTHHQMTMMDEVHAMIHISGHHREEGPFKALDYICVTEDEINSWDNKKLLQTHATHEIHVVPSNTSFKEKDFSKETCQWLGMNVYQTHEVHNGQARTDNPHNEMCHSSLSQLFDSDPNISGRQDVNFLSISLPLYTQPQTTYGNYLSWALLPKKAHSPLFPLRV
ncbi:hypothetical protein K439DRAFT_1624130 [Ramaria rubella]|nr:hypothetical protein K439DRAFT_1624130 [Ramaria rubella]